ncbi:MAG: N-methyl-D-aspartate receptor NMDAR2C subunit [Verrucomicrobia bacterium]|nr:N-methyl-D-aspartate receptor NMDAR2C subunit [Verrucomicrobiota bacterium]
MNWPEQDRWLQLWQAAGLGGDAPAWYEKLTAAYAEPQRHYHNQQHIAECLAEFDNARHLAQDPAAVELALWFHDAVYDPKAGDNEERSAAMAVNCLEGEGQSKLAATVGRLVMATKSHSIEAGPDAGLLVDVDLSILGKDEARFSEYEAQIREEYRWVPGMVFKPKRAEILQRFLDRRRIYTTDLFAARYEANARRNLGNSIRKLKGV